MGLEHASGGNAAWKVLVNWWPVALAFLFVALLPLERRIEIPLSLLALSLAFLARSAERRSQIRQASRYILPLFLCIWIPMLLSSFDSLDPAKSWAHTVPSLRFLAAALAIAVLLAETASRDMLLRLACWLLLFWAVDGYIQLLFGRDVFGVPMHEDRLNALFSESYFSYGPTLALFSPLAMEHMRRHWPMPAWLLGFALIFGAVLISGMRSAWVIMLVVTAAFVLPLLRERQRRHQAGLFAVAAAVMVAIAVLVSPLLQERLRLSSLVAIGTTEAIDEATSYRLPIFTNALAMYADHPVNGIGVRAMRTAYLQYADPDDPHILVNPEKNRGHQAHNIVLEFMTDTGTIGLLGLILAWVYTWRWWRSLSDIGRSEAFPYAVALMALAFPLNSYFAMFGVYMMSITWVLVGLMGASTLADTGRDPWRRSR